jgi:hypothetical protein
VEVCRACDGALLWRVLGETMETKSGVITVKLRRVGGLGCGVTTRTVVK